MNTHPFLLALGLVVLAIAPSRLIEAPSVGLVASAVEIEAVLAECGDCETDGCLGSTEHTVPGGGGARGSVHSYCLSCSQGCELCHPKCSGNDTFGSADDVRTIQALIADAVDGSKDALIRLGSEFPAQTEVNLERQALQVISACSQLSVIAHLPADRSVLEHLVARRGVAGGGPRHPTSRAASVGVGLEDGVLTSR
jgi:hypothetical protein